MALKTMIPLKLNTFFIIFLADFKARFLICLHYCPVQKKWIFIGQHTPNDTC